MAEQLDASRDVAHTACSMMQAKGKVYFMC